MDFKCTIKIVKIWNIIVFLNLSIFLIIEASPVELELQFESLKHDVDSLKESMRSLESYISTKRGETKNRAQNYNFETIPIRMPNIFIQDDDAYICYAEKLNTARKSYIVGMELLPTDKKRIHHVNVVVCGNVTVLGTHWNCGKQHVCSGGGVPLWTWAGYGADVTSWTLPEDVGVAVGGDSPYSYVAVQIHYAEKFKPGVTDASGVNIFSTTQPREYEAGLLLLGGRGYIPPHSDQSLIDIACNWNREDLHIISYKVHTHELGKMVMGYHVRNDTWSLIGRVDPMVNQAYLPAVTHDVTVKKGDALAARCIMKNNRPNKVMFRDKDIDEMCNFCILFKHKPEAGTPLKMITCAGDAQTFRWTDHFHNIPAQSYIL